MSLQMTREGLTLDLLSALISSVRGDVLLTSRDH